MQSTIDHSARQDAHRFLFDGGTYSLAEMLSANSHDDEVCEFCRQAQPGDRFNDLECVAAEPADRRRADAPADWPFGTLTARQQRERRSFENRLRASLLAKWPEALL